ncbi:hypothetical protein GC209_15760 [bacterium]|nr:hypothetical protein [bacterium]
MNPYAAGAVDAVTRVNSADPDMVGACQTPDVQAMVIWNPTMSEIARLPDATKVFDRAQISGEVIDLMVANTATLTEGPDSGRARAGIRDETTTLMSADMPEGTAARAAIGKASGTDQAGFESHTAASRRFANADEPMTFTESPDLGKTMDAVRGFLCDRGPLGLGATSVDAVGIGA